MKSSLLDILLTQARQALRALQRKDCSPSERQRQISDLLGAALLLDEEAIETEVQGIANKLSGVGAQGGGERDLAQLVERLSEQRRPLSTEESEKLSSPSATADNGSFDAEEHILLLDIFRDEADEGLQKISQLLLSAGTEKPTEDQINEIMRLTHGLKGAAGTVGLPRVARVAHDFEGIFQRIRNAALPWSQSLRDDLIEFSDSLLMAVVEARTPKQASSAASQIHGRLAHIEAKYPQSDSQPEADQDIKTDKFASLIVTEAQSEQTYKERRRPDRRGADSPMLRVEPGRIDRLMDSVGELVFDRTRIQKRIKKISSELLLLQRALNTTPETGEQAGRDNWKTRAMRAESALADLRCSASAMLPTLDHELARLGEDASRLRSTEFALQDGLTAVRMQSIASLFGRLTPQLRAIARQAKRQVQLVTAGGDTEFDKAVADKLVDPLIQIMRNAVAHGIEPPDHRDALGKPREGKIMVTARHEGNVIVIEVSDDGAGIDCSLLRTALVQQGRLTQPQASTIRDERLVQMIFEAGFSSRTEADQLAGRGVGLSSVRETVTRLGGEVRVSSQPGQGTRFSLRLPLTTLVANALLFKIGGHVFALPSANVAKRGETEFHACLPLGPSIDDRHGLAVPLISLHDLLSFPIPEGASSCPLIPLDFMGKRLAVSCDRIIGTREIIVKNLGPMLAGISLYAGGTISPSGKVQLILDPATLATLAYPDQHIPLTPPPPEDEIATETFAKKSEAAVARRVLVVDDSKVIREAMRRMLDRAGFEVDTAEDGAAAWTCLLQRTYGLVVTDLEMPGEDGFALLSRAHNLIRRSGLRVLVISSNDTKGSRSRAADLGAAKFLSKPVTQALLIDTLREIQNDS